MRYTDKSMLDVYMEYTRQTESHPVYHRWNFLTSVAAAMGRKSWVEHGHFRIFPNLYVMLIGNPGARKSTSIKIARKLLSASGYDKFAADESSKEKFLEDLEGLKEDQEGQDNVGYQEYKSYKPDNRNRKTVDITDKNLWGTDSELAEPKEVFIVADEFNEFAGAGNLGFYSTLGNLWDWDNPNSSYKKRLKNSRSISIFQPTVSILAGNTPENFARAFPPEIIGQGFFSRLLLIYGEETEDRYTIPVVPREDTTLEINAFFKNIHTSLSNKSVNFQEPAFLLLDSIYKTWTAIDDSRFRSYSTRRLSTLIKLCLILYQIRGLREGIERETLIEANTYLTAAEINMPRALGEFGKSKYSDVSHNIVQVMINHGLPMKARQIWTHVSRDLEKQQMLIDILNSLLQAGRIQNTPDGFLPKRKAIDKYENVDWSYLTQKERDLINVFL